MVRSDSRMSVMSHLSLLSHVKLTLLGLMSFVVKHQILWAREGTRLSVEESHSSSLPSRFGIRPYGPLVILVFSSTRRAPLTAPASALSRSNRCFWLLCVRIIL